MLGVNQKDSYKERISKNTLMRIPIRKRTLQQGREVNPLLYICMYKEISCAPCLVLIKKTPTRKEFRKIHS